LRFYQGKNLFGKELVSTNLILAMQYIFYRLFHYKIR